MKRKALILVVDDNAECRESLVWILEQYGFTTISAKSGREAIELAAIYRPALVLMDLNMPDMNGCEATRTIRADRHTRGIPIVAVSADCAGLGARAFKAGFIAVLEKPWKHEALLEIVTTVLIGDVENRNAA